MRVTPRFAFELLPKLAVIAALLACGRGKTDEPKPAARPRTFIVQPVWFDGIGDEDRPTLDRFLSCLVDGSNFSSWWNGEVELVLNASVTLPAPSAALRQEELPAWIERHLEAGGIELPEAGRATLVLLTFTGWPMMRIGPCGYSEVVRIGGHEVDLAVVRTAPLCWPGTEAVRNETQIAAHELVESIDWILGDVGCAADDACQGSSACADRCDAFVGLMCPGAPTGTWTGCNGGRVDGWVVQRFSNEVRDKAQCNTCAVCDFTPTACPDAPGCAAESSASAP